MQQTKTKFYPAFLSLLFFFTALLAVPPLQAQHQKSVRFCIPNADVYPFFIYTDNQISGTNPDIMRAIFAKQSLQNYRIEFVQRPWKRCNVELQQGTVDFVIGSYTKERDSLAVYPNELGLVNAENVFSTADICFISANGEQLERTRNGMAGQNSFTVGAEAGFSQNHDSNMVIDWLVIYNHLEKYRLLQKGRVDAISQVCALDNHPIATKAQVSGFQDFVTVYPAYLSSPGYIVFSRQFIKRNSLLAKTMLLEANNIDKAKIYAKYRLD